MSKRMKLLKIPTELDEWVERVKSNEDITLQMLFIWALDVLAKTRHELDDYGLPPFNAINYRGNIPNDLEER